MFPYRRDGAGGLGLNLPEEVEEHIEVIADHVCGAGQDCLVPLALPSETNLC